MGKHLFPLFLERLFCDDGNWIKKKQPCVKYMLCKELRALLFAVNTEMWRRDAPAAVEETRGSEI